MEIFKLFKVSFFTFMYFINVAMAVLVLTILDADIFSVMLFLIPIFLTAHCIIVFSISKHCFNSGEWTECKRDNIASIGVMFISCIVFLILNLKNGLYASLTAPTSFVDFSGFVRLFVFLGYTLSSVVYIVFILICCGIIDTKKKN